MADTQNRGRIKVGTDSWMWRWYHAWQLRKGDQRAVPDLCHFVRVLLIFSPWRWFWDLNHRVPPFIVAALGLIVGAFTYLILNWPDTVATAALYFLVILLLVGAVAGVIVLVAYSIIRWRNVDQERADEVLLGILKWGTVWLWFPIFCLAWAAERLWYRILRRPFRRVFAKPLFYLGYREYLVGIWIYTFLVIFAYGLALAYWTRPTVLITVGVITSAIVISAVVTGVYLSIKRIQRWLEERPAPPPRPVKIEPEKPQKERWRGTRLFWAWLVAKKHRICPLIEPIGETHE